MASFLVRSVRSTARPSVASVFNRAFTVVSSAALPNSPSLFVRLRPLVAAASFSYLHRLAPVVSTRGFSTRQTTSSLNDPNPNWSNRPPKETILLDGCDFEHWLVVMEKPEGDPTRDEIIDSYIKTLAMVVGSEEEARMKIYSVSTRHYFAFGALVSEELSYKLKELPRVRWVLPDSYLDVKNKDYGGEPFINGQAVPYDPKYHEEWVRNNARANERNKRNDRPRNFDRSRNFERRREIRNQQGPNEHGGNFEGQPGMAPSPPPNGPNPGMMPPNMGGQPNYGGGMQNPGNYQPNNLRGPPNNPSGYQYNQGPQNTGRPPYHPTPGPNQQGYAPNMPPPQGYAPNAGGGHPYQNQNVPGRDLPPPHVHQNQNVLGRDLPPPPNAGSHPGYAHGQATPNAGYYQGQNAYPSNTGPSQAPNAPGYTTNQNAPGRDY